VPYAHSEFHGGCVFCPGTVGMWSNCSHALSREFARSVRE